MSRRWLLRAVLLLAVLLAGSLLSPDVRWPLWGWLRGEALHRGRPTSYWAGRLRGKSLTLVAEDTYPTVLLSLGDSAPPWAQWENAPRLRLGLSEVYSGEVFLDGQDSASAVPVLMALLKDDDPQVHKVAAFCLSILGPEARKAVPVLVVALRDDDANVRAAAAQALKRIDSQPAAEAGVP
jgi:hypothetical protein